VGFSMCIFSRYLEIKDLTLQVDPSSSVDVASPTRAIRSLVSFLMLMFRNTQLLAQPLRDLHPLRTTLKLRAAFNSKLLLAEHKFLAG
jgi:hypothetical protein